MKRILFIAPAAIPVNGAESIVNFKLLQLLSQNGYVIDLVTKKYKNTTYPDVNIEINNVNVEIIEVDNTVNLKTIFQHLLTWIKLGVCYKGSHWSLCALPVCEKLIQKNHYDYILSKNYPSELLGAYLKQKYNLKWITTWNDPFPQHKYPPPYGDGPDSVKFFTRQLLKKMSCADIHIFPNSRLRDYMLKYLNVKTESTKIVPHLCQTNDVKIKSRTERLELIHSGNLGAQRNPQKFLASFAKLVKLNPSCRIHLTFLGTTGDDIKKLINLYGIQSFVSILPPENYLKSLQRLSDFDVSVIVEAELQEGIFLPTKVGDAMQMKKKIFAVSPKDGVLHDLYKSKKIDYFAEVSCEVSIYNELCRLYNDFEKLEKWDVPQIPEEYQESAILKHYLSL